MDNDKPIEQNTVSASNFTDIAVALYIYLKEDMQHNLRFDEHYPKKLWLEWFFISFDVEEGKKLFGQKGEAYMKDQYYWYRRLKHYGARGAYSFTEEDEKAFLLVYNDLFDLVRGCEDHTKLTANGEKSRLNDLRLNKEYFKHFKLSVVEENLDGKK